MVFSLNLFCFHYNARADAGTCSGPLLFPGLGWALWGKIIKNEGNLSL